MKILNAVLACAITFAAIPAEARLESAKHVSDTGLKAIQKTIHTFYEENSLGMSFIVTGAGTYDDVSDFGSESVNQFLTDSKILRTTDEADVKKVRKVKTVSKTTDAIKTELDKTFAVIQEIIDRNKKFKPELGGNRDSFMGTLKQKSIAWALSKDNAQASVLRTSVYIDSDAMDADDSRYRSLDGEIMIYVQPEGKEFLIVLMGEQHD